jgi:hypothetical protein
MLDKWISSYYCLAMHIEVDPEAQKRNLPPFFGGFGLGGGGGFGLGGGGGFGLGGGGGFGLGGGGGEFCLGGCGGEFCLGAGEEFCIGVCGGGFGLGACAGWFCLGVCGGGGEGSGSSISHSSPSSCKLRRIMTHLPPFLLPLRFPREEADCAGSCACGLGGE